MKKVANYWDKIYLFVLNYFIIKNNFPANKFAAKI